MSVTAIGIVLSDLRAERDRLISNVLIPLRPAIESIEEVIPCTEDPEEAARLVEELRSLREAMSQAQAPWPASCREQLLSAVVELRYVRTPGEAPEKTDRLYNATIWLLESLTAVSALVTVARRINDMERLFGEREGDRVQPATESA